jgi:hypothetical protein
LDDEFTAVADKGTCPAVAALAAPGRISNIFRIKADGTSPDRAGPCARKGMIVMVRYELLLGGERFR